MSENMMGWVSFNVFVLGMLALDLGVFHRKPHDIGFKEAIGWSFFWILLAMLFNAWIFHLKGSEVGLQFLTGYLIEKSLSVDNLFVFLLIFSYFKVPSKYQHEVLFWGIVGALVFRALFIALGITLLEKFHWLIYVFGGFLVFTGVKLAFEKDKEIHPEKNPVLKLVRKIMPVTSHYEDGKFFVKKDKKVWATPLLIVLLVIETTDIIFAVDSIPAILAITKDPFIVYTSNVFAILGLRALYFALSGVMRLFHHLHYGLAFILCFVGGKMLIADHYKVPVVLSLTVIASALALSVGASLLWPQHKRSDEHTG
jgi:tellurite resistance protein TerC